MILIAIDRASSTPAYLQIRDRIVALIDEGTLRAGDRLPPSRDLADVIGVHRSTVVRAYDEIRALGCLESRPGGYTTVRRRARPLTTAIGKDAKSGVFDWSDRSGMLESDVRPLGPTPSRTDGGDAIIDFERLAPDPRLAPCDDLRRCFKRALVRGGPAVVDYSDPTGWRPLREFVSSRLRAHGVVTSAEEILITYGAQHAIDLVLRMRVREGEQVVVESPTYGMAHTLLRLHRVRPIEVPMLAHGMDLDALEQLLRRDHPKLLYTMPNFHNPTGVTTTQAHRERLLALCESAGVPLLEDGFEEEMKYGGQAVLPIKAMDAKGVVLYVGTLSKVVFPGLRVGWIAAPRDAITLLSAIAHASCLAPNTLAQAAVERFCRGGDLETHLKRTHRIYRRRMKTMLQSLEAHLPPSVKWTRPAGGYTVWLTLPGRAEDEQRWCDRLADAGVRVAPGGIFYGNVPAEPHLRLSVACVDEEQIREGCRRMGRIAVEWGSRQSGGGDWR